MTRTSAEKRQCALVLRRLIYGRLGFKFAGAAIERQVMKICRRLIAVTGSSELPAWVTREILHGILAGGAWPDIEEAAAAATAVIEDVALAAPAVIEGVGLVPKKMTAGRMRSKCLDVYFTENKSSLALQQEVGLHGPALRQACRRQASVDFDSLASLVKMQYIGKVRQVRLRKTSDGRWQSAGSVAAASDDIVVASDIALLTPVKKKTVGDPEGVWSTVKANLRKKVHGGVSGALHEASKHYNFWRKRAKELLGIGRVIWRGSFKATSAVTKGNTKKFRRGLGNLAR